MRKFNVTGVCVPSKHYMVDISNKLKQITTLIDEGSYFTLNRARQYGKTTTLASLTHILEHSYTVILLSFEGLGTESFVNAKVFCHMFMELVGEALEFTDVSEEYRESWLDYEVIDFKKLSRHLTKMCKNQKLVLMIDEVDKVSNNQVFLNFLSVLRSKYLASQKERDFTFQSVILAGVYDIKNIKLKLINAGIHAPVQTEGTVYNSPWNIAINFKVDMSFSPDEISTMLNDYEIDHDIGMNIKTIAEEIYRYTSGYPFLVSRVCQCLAEELGNNWTPKGIQEAMQIILIEKNTLFDDLAKNLENNLSLRELLYDVLILGQRRTFSFDVPTIDLASMYGYIKNERQRIGIANKIFEIRICNYFIAKDEKMSYSKIKGVFYHDVIVDDHFNMEYCLKKFAEHYHEIFNEKDDSFLERHGRIIFLSFLKPLLNGYGFYHIESQTTNERRMDLVVDFGCDQFIIELKLWYGEAAQEKAYDQLLGYMNAKNNDKGYLLTFDFRKDTNKEFKAEWIQIEDKQIFEVIV